MATTYQTVNPATGRQWTNEEIRRQRGQGRPATGPGTPGYGKPLGIDPTRQPPPSRYSPMTGKGLGWGVDVRGEPPGRGKWFWKKLGRGATRGAGWAGLPGAAMTWADELKRRRETMTPGKQFARSLTDVIPGMGLTGIGMAEEEYEEAREDPASLALARSLGFPVDVTTAGINAIVSGVGGPEQLINNPWLGSEWLLKNRGWTVSDIADAIRTMPSEAWQIKEGAKGVQELAAEIPGWLKYGQQQYEAVTGDSADAIVSEADQELEESKSIVQEVVDGALSAWDWMTHLVEREQEKVPEGKIHTLDLGNIKATPPEKDEVLAKGTSTAKMEDGTTIPVSTERVSGIDDLLERYGLGKGDLNKNLKSVEKTYAQLFALGTLGGVGTSAATGFMNSSLGMMRLQQDERQFMIRMLMQPPVTLYPYVIDENGRFSWKPGGKIKSVPSWMAGQYSSTHSPTAPTNQMTNADERNLIDTTRILKNDKDVYKAWTVVANRQAAQPGGILQTNPNLAIGSYITNILWSEYPELREYLKLVPDPATYQEMIRMLGGKKPEDAIQAGTLPQSEWDNWLAVFGRWTPGTGML